MELVFAAQPAQELEAWRQQATQLVVVQPVERALRREPAWVAPQE